MARVILSPLPAIFRFMFFYLLPFQPCLVAVASLPITTHGQHLSIKNNRQNPDQKNSLSEAILTYEQTFSVNRHTTKLPEHCHRNPHRKTIVICEAHVHLIRPDRTIREWQHQQARNNRVILKMADMGLDAVEARLITVRHLSRRQLPAGTVTGTFERFSQNVQRYRFLDEITKQTDTVLATPEHRFYSFTRRAYVPLSALGNNDRLMTANGHFTKLVCPTGHHKRCGESLTGHPLRLVHNLEVAVDHVYFAGQLHVLVHNGYFYQCTACKVNRPERDNFNEEHLKQHGNKIRKMYLCEHCHYAHQAGFGIENHTKLMHTPFYDLESGINYSSRAEKNHSHNQIHSDNWTCEYCNRLILRTNYRKHLTTHYVTLCESPDMMFKEPSPETANAKITSPINTGLSSIDAATQNTPDSESDFSISIPLSRLGGYTLPGMASTTIDSTTVDSEEAESLEDFFDG